MLHINVEGKLYMLTEVDSVDKDSVEVKIQKPITNEIYNVKCDKILLQRHLTNKVVEMVYTFEKGRRLIDDNKLPKDFKDWDICNNDDYTLAHYAASKRLLPANFERWHLSDKDGWSVAHEYASFNTFPLEFSLWWLSDKDGYTVAHTAAMYNTLPRGFNLWSLCDSGGTTVAHTAAEFGNLPADFDNWMLVDGYGKTVEYVDKNRQMLR